MTCSLSGHVPCLNHQFPTCGIVIVMVAEWFAGPSSSFFSQVFNFAQQVHVELKIINHNLFLEVPLTRHILILKPPSGLLSF